MKQSSYILKIDNPCSESWQVMKANDVGRYCANCQKSVIDFTSLTDNEVLQIIKQTNGKLCGRLNSEQMNRVLIGTKQQSTNTKLHKILAGLLLLSSSENIIANKQHSETQIVFKSINENLTVSTGENLNNQLSDSLKNIVQGKVIVANNKDVIPFASVLIKNTNIVTTTDIDGNFKITIPENLLADTGKIILKVVYVGYGPDEFTINKKDLPITKGVYEMKYGGNVTMGIIIATPPAKRKWWQRKKKVTE
jgi:hypothetical protein